MKAQNERLNLCVLDAFAAMDRATPYQKTVILVVEDDPFVRFRAADVLEGQGFAVAEAANVENAMRVLESRQDINLVFTDMALHGNLDGMVLARRVQARWPGIQFVITGAKEATLAEMPKNGRFIAKPYSSLDLVRAINGA